MLFVNFTGRLLCFLEEQVDLLCFTCSVQALKREMGGFFQDFFAVLSFHLSRFDVDREKHLGVPAQSNAIKSHVLGHFIYFDKINK